jgi:cyclic pyranopterin phosphate synthase
MIDISKKKSIIRIARASGKIFLKSETIERIRDKLVQKGDVETIARIAAISAVKQTASLIPMCHPIPIANVSFSMNLEGNNCVNVSCTVKSQGKTGVEMEALTGVNVALLNIWDVVKMYEKDKNGQYPSTIMTSIKVEEKIKQEQTTKNER